MPALDYITIKGFKSISSIEKMPLAPINVLIGPNGAGKSNFIGAFSFLHSVREGRLQEYVRRAGGAEQLLHFGSKQTEAIEFHLSFQNEVNQYKLRLLPTSDDSLAPIEETALYWDKVKHPRPWDTGLSSHRKGGEAGISNPETNSKVVEWVRHRLGGWRVYHVHDTSVDAPTRKTANVHDNAFLRADGSNLAAFLYLLQEQYQDSFKLIRGVVQRVAPFFDDFVLRPEPLNPETIRLAWKHRSSDKYFGASALSDGSLRFIVLATLFLQPQPLRPSLMLVDEPELGLHPSAITLLAALVKQAAATTQVVLSTQSPILLDHFEPEDVLIANRAEDATHLRRLDRTRLESWLQEYSLGQLWEKNELGGRPEGRE
jgi:predicted ATPase